MNPQKCNSFSLHFAELDHTQVRCRLWKETARFDILS